MNEEMVTGIDFLHGVPIQVLNQSVYVIRQNYDEPTMLTIVPSTSLLRSGSTIVRLRDELTTTWPTFMHELNAVPEIANVIAFEDRVVIERDEDRSSSWEEIADKLVFVFRRALQSAVYKLTGHDMRSVPHTMFP